MAIAATVLYAVYPPDWPGTVAVREFCVVLASVAAAAIFLPELSSGLWTIREQQVRELVPQDKILHLQAALMRSRVSEREWADAILNEAVNPLVEAASQPQRVMGDLSYSVQVHLNQLVSLGDTSILMHQVETTQRARRILPSTTQKYLWVAIGRNEDLIRTEYTQDACLAREIVEFDKNWTDEKWQEFAKKFCSARIVINGVTITASTKAPNDHADPLPGGLLRWYFPIELAPHLDGGRATSAVAIDYPMSVQQNSIPVMLASYYCMGTVSLSIAVYGDPEIVLHGEVFLAHALGRPVDATYIEKGGLCKQITICTSDGALLWPGSGVSVWWDRPGANSEPGASSHGSVQEAPTMLVSAVNKGYREVTLTEEEVQLSAAENDALVASGDQTGHDIDESHAVR